MTRLSGMGDPGYDPWADEDDDPDDHFDSGSCHCNDEGDEWPH
jgi:hypothetical protein